MDKLKKQIFIALAALLLVSAVTLALLLNTKRAPLPTQNTEASPLPATQSVEAQTPEPPSLEQELARLLTPETHQKVLDLLQKHPSPASAYGIGMVDILNKHNSAAMRENAEYKQLINKLWLQYHPQAQALPKQNLWQNIPCQTQRLPNNTPDGLSCKESELGFCALFENGRPYFCQAKDTQIKYLLNKWGSSITVTHKSPEEKSFYYADGKLARYTQYNPKTQTLTQIRFNGAALQLTQTTPDGKVLHKYYFNPGQPYVHYPGGNDMGEINGLWEEKDGQIWTDGRPLLTLPDNSPAPDVCQIFAGACEPAQTQGAQNGPGGASK